MLAQLAAAIVLAALLSAEPGLALADPESCPPDARWESLCNVEPELRRSYLRLERVAELAYFRERISGMVRDRRVTIVWDWSITDRDHLGGFHRRTRQVLMPAHLRGNPDRVEAAIMAHELWHAHADHQGWHLPLTPQSCVEDERQAFKVGLLFYVRLHAAEAPPEPATDVDGHLWLLAREWHQRGGTEDALNGLAQEHVADRGYVFLCAFVNQPYQCEPQRGACVRRSSRAPTSPAGQSARIPSSSFSRSAL